MELNREQIIKALECCETGRAVSCEKCPMQNIEAADDVVCSEMLARYAISLIKELTEERDGFENLAHTAIEVQNRMSDTIEELTEEYESMAQSVNEASDLIRKLRVEKKELTEENERLNKEVDRLSQVVLYHDGITEMEVEEAKDDTVRKMQERVKEYFPYDADSGLYVVLDQIAKEIIEGETK